MGARTTTRRRQLGAMMRKLRARKGMTLEEAGQLVGVSKATVSRYETKEGPVKWLVVDALCQQYGASNAERETAVGLAKAADRQNWWDSYADYISESEADLLLALEDEAVREDHFACVYVPGLLQTREYAMAVQHTSEVRRTPNEIAQLADLRMQRQKVLERSQPPRLQVVLDESVLRRVVGSREVMRGQLTRLLRAVDSPDITLQILPFSVGAHSAAKGSFVVLGGAQPWLDVVYVETHVGALFLEKTPELDRYRLAFDYLQAQALDASDSSAFIEQAISEM